MVVFFAEIGGPPPGWGTSVKQGGTLVKYGKQIPARRLVTKRTHCDKGWLLELCITVVLTVFKNCMLGGFSMAVHITPRSENNNGDTCVVECTG